VDTGGGIHIDGDSDKSDSKICTDFVHKTQKINVRNQQKTALSYVTKLLYEICIEHKFKQARASDAVFISVVISCHFSVKILIKFNLLCIFGKEKTPELEFISRTLKSLILLENYAFARIIQKTAVANFR